MSIYEGDTQCDDITINRHFLSYIGQSKPRFTILGLTLLEISVAFAPLFLAPAVGLRGPLGPARGLQSPPLPTIPPIC